MKRMSFDVSCVRNFLDEVGVVYSVRSYELREKSFVEVDGIGLCGREFIREVRKLEDIKGVSGWSGFDNVKEWLEVILSMYKSKRKFLYRVEKIGGEC